MKGVGVISCDSGNRIPTYFLSIYSQTVPQLQHSVMVGKQTLNSHFLFYEIRGQSLGAEVFLQESSSSIRGTDLSGLLPSPSFALSASVLLSLLYKEASMKYNLLAQQ